MAGCGKGRLRTPPPPAIRTTLTNIKSCLRRHRFQGALVGLSQNFPGSGPIARTEQVLIVAFPSATQSDNDFAIVDATPSAQRARELQRAYPVALSHVTETRANVLVVWMTRRTPAKRRFIASCV